MAVTVLLCGGWAAAGLCFRFLAYGSMPVTPGDPYGEVDVLELVHYGVLLVLSGLACRASFSWAWGASTSDGSLPSCVYSGLPCHSRTARFTVGSQRSQPDSDALQGRTVGVAVSRRSSELVYWAESW